MLVTATACGRILAVQADAQSTESRKKASGMIRMSNRFCAVYGREEGHLR